SLNTKNDFMRF
uniref:FMRFamide-11 n=1 Tax=Sarcophaga bullata TaxID=7385 RepID=FAR11_SARBU|nr:RecName: Full=FMRFamide-11; AltName: Full=SabFMRFamide-11 [Sarcophaga bullata]